MLLMIIDGRINKPATDGVGELRTDVLETVTEGDEIVVGSVSVVDGGTSVGVTRGNKYFMIISSLTYRKSK